MKVTSRVSEHLNMYTDNFEMENPCPPKSSKAAYFDHLKMKLIMLFKNCMFSIFEIDIDEA